MKPDRSKYWDRTVLGLGLTHNEYKYLEEAARLAGYDLPEWAKGRLFAEAEAIHAYEQEERP